MYIPRLSADRWASALNAIWNFSFPNKGPASLSSLITNESAFLFRFLVQSRSIGNHLFYFFCPAGRWWMIIAESARLQRSCCSGLCPTPFPVPHLSLYFHKHTKLSACRCEGSPAYCRALFRVVETETVPREWIYFQYFGLLFSSWLYCNLRNTHSGECCWCCLGLLSLCVTVANSWILVIKPTQPFVLCCSATDGTPFDFCCTSEEKGPKCSSTLDLFTGTSVQPFINQWTPGCAQTYLTLSQWNAEDMDRQEGSFRIISNFRAAELFMVLKQPKGAFWTWVQSLCPGYQLCNVMSWVIPV